LESAGYRNKEIPEKTPKSDKTIGQFSTNTYNDICKPLETTRAGATAGELPQETNVKQSNICATSKEYQF